MSGRKSRDKGCRGEREIAKLLHAKRLGVAWKKTEIDVGNEFCHVQVKNKQMGGGAILTALEALEGESNSDHAQYVVFKAGRGVWLVCERISQHVSHHVGDTE